MPVMPVVPPMVVVVVIMHFGHQLFRTVLDHRGGARIDQRQRLRSFGRNGQSQNRYDAFPPSEIDPASMSLRRLARKA